MKEDDEYQMQLEENFLKHIGFEHVGYLNAMMDDGSMDIGQIEYPMGLDQWFIDFHKMEKKRQQKILRKGSRVHLKRVASMIVLSLVGINILLITNVEAYRQSIFDVFINIKSEFTQIDFQNDEFISDEYLPVEWVGKFYPTELPSGYQFHKMYSQPHVSILIFVNEEGETISFYQSSVRLSHQVNTENGVVKKIMVGDNDGLYVQNDNSMILTWRYSGYYLCLEASGMEDEQLIYIAENIDIKQ